MKITITDKSCLRPVTDTIVDPAAKHILPMGFYFNDRVLKATGRWVRFWLLATEDETNKATPRGYARQYYCPVCGRPFWCLPSETKQPAITCRKCTSDSVLLFFGTPLAERLSWAYTTLLSENYDPFVHGDSTVEGKVIKKWVVHPEEFIKFWQPRLEDKTDDAKYDGGPVWLVARGKCWDEEATLMRSDDPRGARVRIL